MRILVDECLPKRLKRDLIGHEARTVPEMGWASKRNGELLALAESRFEVFLTVDRNLSFQQDIGRLKIAVFFALSPADRRGVLEVAAARSGRAVSEANVERSLDAINPENVCLFIYCGMRRDNRRLPACQIP